MFKRVFLVKNVFPAVKRQTNLKSSWLLAGTKSHMNTFWCTGSCLSQQDEVWESDEAIINLYIVMKFQKFV